MATRAQITVNGTVGSNDDITLNTLVQLNNDGLGGETSYSWTIVSQPSPATVTLSNPTIQTPTFTPNKEGSYLIELVVNAGQIGQAVDRVIVAVRELETRNRIPAAGETTENDAATGWANTAVDQILQRVTRFTDSGIIVGKAAQSDLLPLDVVYTWDITTIATGLPGERPVPYWKRASAVVPGEVQGLLGLVLGGVDGAPAPGLNDLVRVAVLRLVQSVQLGSAGLPRGTPVYVDDAGHLSVTPGTTIRQVGSTLDDMGAGAYGIWFTGEGTFGTLQDISGTAPIEVTPGITPTVSLARTADLAVEAGALALSTTGVTAGAYGNPAATPESVMPTLTVDAKGRLTAAGSGAVQIGGLGAKAYVDAGDATTLASANAYTDARTFGTSSKVPVHAATTEALPANTVNGTFQTLTANVHGPLPLIDGHQMAVGERLLVKNEVASANNGIYVVTQLGASSGPSSPWILTRADDANSAAELCGSLVTVNVGDTLAGTAWLFAFNPSTFVLGTTPVVWTQLNAVPATSSVLGTVRLQGGLSGSGSTAQTPILNVASGNVTGTLAASNGGTGLTTSGSADAFLVGNGSGGWTTRSSYKTSSIFGGALINEPQVIKGIDYGDGYSTIAIGDSFGPTSVRLQSPTGRSIQIQPATFALQSAGGSVTIQGESALAASASGGNVTVRGGQTKAENALVLIAGSDSENATGGKVLIVGGDVSSTSSVNKPGGNIEISGGSGRGDQSGGQVLIRGGEVNNPTAGVVAGRVVIGGGNLSQNVDGGYVWIVGGTGASSSTSRKGGNVFIQPGYNSSYLGNEDLYGTVFIERAQINGTPVDAGKVFTSMGSGQLPSWQDASRSVVDLITSNPAATLAGSLIEIASTAAFRLYANRNYTLSLTPVLNAAFGYMRASNSSGSDGVVYVEFRIVSAANPATVLGKFTTQFWVSNGQVVNLIPATVVAPNTVDQQVIAKLFVGNSSVAMTGGWADLDLVLSQ